jgi:hypothetical protein
MSRLDRHVLTMHRAAQLHQAATIVCDQRVGAAFFKPLDLILRHRH